MNRPKIGFITYIYILYYQASINFKFSSNLAGSPDILFEIRHNAIPKRQISDVTSWQYVFIITQMSVNKQFYWMALKLVRPNSAYVDMP